MKQSVFLEKKSEKCEILGLIKVHWIYFLQMILLLFCVSFQCYHSIYIGLESWVATLLCLRAFVGLERMVFNLGDMWEKKMRGWVNFHLLSINGRIVIFININNVERGIALILPILIEKKTICLLIIVPFFLTLLNS